MSNPDLIRVRESISTLAIADRNITMELVKGLRASRDRHRNPHFTLALALVGLETLAILDDAAREQAARNARG
jgi:hypothetical protein